MNKLKYFITLVLFISTFSLFSQSIKVQTIILKNGLTVYLCEDDSKPEVFGAVIVKAGGKDDPKDATGMAHYQEHMLFKGTQTLGTTNWQREKPHIDRIFELYDELGLTTDPEARKKVQVKINKESLEAAKYAIPNEFSNIVKSMGGTKLNAGTGPDHTVFYNAFPSNQIHKWINLYSHRFINPVFRSFQAELEVVYEEKNMYSEMFISPLIEEFNRNFFKNHPYGQQTLIGTTEDLKNPSLTKMYDFFKTYYVASNMALVLVGDFKSDEIIPEIMEAFGKLERGNPNEKVIYQEKDFVGREFAKVKMSPIGIGLIGYRTPGAGNEEEMAIDICNRILTNESQTGLLDKLVLDNKIMAAQVISMPYIDYGANLVLFVPKIIGQNLKDGEQLVLEEIIKLRKGEFDENLIETIKKELYIDLQLSLESNEKKAKLLLDIFSQGKRAEYINELSSAINNINKTDVLAAANKYYGDNFLAFHSKIGSAKKDKIDKPNFEPLKVNTNAKSIYSRKIEGIERIEAQDLNKEPLIFKALPRQLHHGGELFFTHNKLNDIFSIKIKFGIGEYEIPMLKYAVRMMNYAGTEKLSLIDIKKQFSLLGCRYSFYSDDSFVYATLEGMEGNYNEALLLFTDLLYNPVLEQNKIKNIVSEVKAERKLENSETDNIADALFSYVRYKEKSRFLDRLTMKELKELQANDLMKIYTDAINLYYVEVHITGIEQENKMSKESVSLYKLNLDRMKSTSPIDMATEKYTENTVFFVHKKKARQSKIYFFANGKSFNKNDKPYIDAFNMYFGGGFSGLVLQEVREYRSLAYSAGAKFSIPKKSEQNINFVGYVGTQADKTLEAMDVFNSLIRNMPNKKERMPMIRSYLTQYELTNQPHFRNLSLKVAEWELQGYNEYPLIQNASIYKELSYNDISQFYKENLKDKPIVTIIVSDKKKIDIKDLEKYGKLIIIKEKDLFKNK